MTDYTHYKMLIDGQWVPASDGAKFNSLNPTTGKVWATVPEATAEDVDRAVRAADRAFNQGPWPAMSASERGHCLRRLAMLLAERSDELGTIETTDTGKMLKETRWQAKYISEFFHFFAGCADKIHGETLPIDKPDLFVFTNREPLGVIAAVVPWNSQLFLSAVKIGPALAAGNTIVLKASEFASAAMLEFGSLISEAGIPDGVVNIVTGHGDPCGRVLTSHPLVARISFTGGPNAARHVIGNSTHNFAEVSLELGGKSPNIILNDADLEAAVTRGVLHMYNNTGQSCNAPSRMLVPRDRLAEAEQIAAAVSESIVVGDTASQDTNMGPVVSKVQWDKIQGLIQQGIDEGAKLVCGGTGLPDGVETGHYVRPTVFSEANNDMVISREEIFGPVLTMIPYDSEEEAIRIANDTPYGLAGYVQSGDMDHARLVAAKIRAGNIHINGASGGADIPFGGYKQSGNGREWGSHGFTDYLEIKAIEGYSAA